MRAGLRLPWGVSEQQVGNADNAVQLSVNINGGMLYLYWWYSFIGRQLFVSSQRACVVPVSTDLCEVFIAISGILEVSTK